MSPEEHDSADWTPGEVRLRSAFASRPLPPESEAARERVLAAARSRLEARGSGALSRGHKPRIRKGLWLSAAGLAAAAAIIVFLALPRTPLEQAEPVARKAATGAPDGRDGLLAEIDQRLEKLQGQVSTGTGRTRLFERGRFGQGLSRRTARLRGELLKERGPV